MPRTFEYKLAGPVMQAEIGIDAKITEFISAFAEYKFDYSWNSPNLNGGGSLEANIGTSQFILGVSYKSQLLHHPRIPKVNPSLAILPRRATIPA